MDQSSTRESSDSPELHQTTQQQQQFRQKHFFISSLLRWLVTINHPFSSGFSGVLDADLAHRNFCCGFWPVAKLPSRSEMRPADGLKITTELLKEFQQWLVEPNGLAVKFGQKKALEWSLSSKRSDFLQMYLYVRVKWNHTLRFSILLKIFK